MILKWIDKNLKYIFTLPTIIFVLAMILFPLGYTLVLSFFEWSMSNNVPMQFIGFENYTSLFTDDRFLPAVGRTFYFSAVALLFEVVLGVSIALYLNREMVGKNVVKTAFLLPMVATPVAVGLVWTLIYEPTIGISNVLLQKVGLEPLV